MSLELNDWINFCSGIKSFDKSHFYTLLMDNDDGKGISDFDYKNLFQSFSNSKQLEDRLRKIYATKNLRGEIQDVEAHLLAATKKDIEEKVNLFENSELSEYLLKEIRFVKELAEVRAAKENYWQNEEFTDIIDDFFYDNLNNQDAKTQALLEAFFGLTRNFQMVWYLGEPLLSSEIKFDNYYDIWKIGGEYAITDSGVIVAVEI